MYLRHRRPKGDKDKDNKKTRETREITREITKHIDDRRYKSHKSDKSDKSRRSSDPPKTLIQHTYNMVIKSLGFSFDTFKNMMLVYSSLRQFDNFTLSEARFHQLLYSIVIMATELNIVKKYDAEIEKIVNYFEDNKVDNSNITFMTVDDLCAFKSTIIMNEFYIQLSRAGLHSIRGLVRKVSIHYAEDTHFENYAISKEEFLENTDKLTLCYLYTITSDSHVRSWCKIHMGTNEVLLYSLLYYVLGFSMLLTLYKLAYPGAVFAFKKIIDFNLYIISRLLYLAGQMFKDVILDGKTLTEVLGEAASNLSTSTTDIITGAAGAASDSIKAKASTMVNQLISWLN